MNNKKNQKDFEKLAEKLEKYDAAFGYEGSIEVSTTMSENEDQKRFEFFDRKNDEKSLKKMKETLSSSQCKTCNKISISILDDIYLTKHGKCQKCYLKEEKIF